MRTLSLASFHIIDNPPVLQRLRQELRTAIPDLEDPPSWDELGRLPYLSACIEEGTCPFLLSQSLRQRRSTILTFDPWQHSASLTVPPNASPAAAMTLPYLTKTGLFPQVLS